MPTLTVAEAQAQLPQLIDQLRPGKEVVTRDGKPRKCMFLYSYPLEKGDGGKSDSLDRLHEIPGEIARALRRAWATSAVKLRIFG